MMRFVLILLGVFVLSGCQERLPASHATASAESFLTDPARVALHLPATTELTLGTDSDRANANALDPKVRNAVGAFLKSKAVDWRIIAARPIDKHILLWIQFPKIDDGGVDLIYSVEKNRIVGEFLGGYRG